MQTITRTIQLLLSLLTLAVFGWAAWQAYVLLAREQAGLEPGTRSLVIIVAALALVCTYMLATALRKAAVMQALGARKAALYEGFLLAWRQCAEAGDNVLKDTGRQKLSEMAVGMSLIARPAMLQVVNQLLAAAESGAYQQEETLRWIEDLTLAMRTDLGQTNWYKLGEQVRQLYSTTNKN